MSRITALRCDFDGCNAVTTETNAREESWITVGGKRRGKYRVDLCGSHALRVMREITKTVKPRRKRLP